MVTPQTRKKSFWIKAFLLLFLITCYLTAVLYALRNDNGEFFVFVMGLCVILVLSFIGFIIKYLRQKSFTALVLFLAALAIACFIAFKSSINSHVFLIFCALGVCMFLGLVFNPCMAGIVLYKLIKGTSLQARYVFVTSCSPLITIGCFTLKGEISFPTVAIAVLGLLFYFISFATWTIHHFKGLTRVKSFAISCLSVLLFTLWLDLRFCIIVKDSNGERQEVNPEYLFLHRPNRSYFQEYIYAKGHSIGKGCIYFGLVQWLQCKETWIFPSGVSSPKGRNVKDLNWKPAKWSEWPKIVILTEAK